MPAFLYFVEKRKQPPKYKNNNIFMCGDEMKRILQHLLCNYIY